MLDYYFDIEILNDQEKQIIVECEIEELKANETISLPSFIFFKAKEDFVIEYEINSNNLPQKVFGVLSKTLNQTDPTNPIIVSKQKAASHFPGSGFCIWDSQLHFEET